MAEGGVLWLAILLSSLYIGPIAEILVDLLSQCRWDEAELVCVSVLILLR